MSDSDLAICEVPVSRSDDVKIFLLRNWMTVKWVIDLACWLHYSLGI